MTRWQPWQPVWVTSTGMTISEPCPGIPPIAAKLTRRSEDMRPAIRDDVLKTRPTLPFNFRLRTGPERSCGPREHRCAERLQSVNFVWRLSLHVPTEEADGDLVGIEVEQHEAVLLNR
jgi:hypothetical protein